MKKVILKSFFSVALIMMMATGIAGADNEPFFEELPTTETSKEWLVEINKPIDKVPPSNPEYAEAYSLSVKNIGDTAYQFSFEVYVKSPNSPEIMSCIVCNGEPRAVKHNGEGMTINNFALPVSAEEFEVVVTWSNSKEGMPKFKQSFVFNRD